MNRNQTSIIGKAIRLSYRASGNCFLSNLLVSVLSGASGVAVVYVTTALFDQVSAAGIGDGTGGIAGMVPILILYFAILAGKALLDWISDSLGFLISEKSAIALSELLHKKADTLNASSFEDPELLDWMNNAGRGVYFIDYCATNVLNLFFRDLPYLLFIGIYLYTLKPVLFLIPVMIFFPVVLSQILRTKMFIELREEKAPLERKTSRYVSFMTDTEYLKETRSLGCFSFFQKLYMETVELLNRTTWKAEKRSQAGEVLSRLLTLAGYYGVLILLFYALMKRDLSAGEFAAVFASLRMLYSATEHIVCDRIGSILTENFAEIYSLIRYLELPERQYGGKGLENGSGRLQMKEVTFTYPGRSTPAVKNVNLELKRGETVAIVGENGSGKTTLAKLILGIYQSDSGQVSIDGVPYHELDRTSLFRGKSAVFQDYYRYLFQLRTNIAISEIGNEKDEERVEGACKAAGVCWRDNRVFPNGLNTILSKRFGGVELSGGEWQRVAIARGLFKECNLIVLDEPTAAIDPIEEGNVYRKFVEISGDKTSVIITHRLGSAQIADRIIVMSGGEIIQRGTHQSLMRQDGCYKRMYEAQAQWYRD